MSISIQEKEIIKEKIKVFLRTIVPAKFRPRLRKIYTRTYYFGFKYKCPLCHSFLRTFRPYGLNLPVLKQKQVIGGGQREKAVCPVCGSLDRERLLYLYLLLKTDIFQKPKKLLHVAPEKRLSEIIGRQPTIEYVTADLQSKEVKVEMDITDIPFPDCFFDAVLCCHVLEHIIDDRKALNEIYRILSPGGWGVLQVPLSLLLNSTYEDSSVQTREGREKAFGQADHVRIYAKDYENRLQQVGFKVDVFKWINEDKYFGGHRNRFGLNENEFVYFVKKPER